MPAFCTSVAMARARRSRLAIKKVVSGIIARLPSTMTL